MDKFLRDHRAGGGTTGFASDHGFTVMTPVLRKSRWFRVTMDKPRRIAVPTSMASGRWASRGLATPPFGFHDTSTGPAASAAVQVEHPIRGKGGPECLQNGGPDPPAARRARSARFRLRISHTVMDARPTP